MPYLRIFIGIKIHRGGVVDSITLNDKQYGRSSGGVVESITMEPDEIIEEIIYRKAVLVWIDSLCSMIIGTNFNTHVVSFPEWKIQTANYCGETLFSVRIPNNQNLASFFDTELEYNYDNWIIGFQNETVIS